MTHIVWYQLFFCQNWIFKIHLDTCRDFVLLLYIVIAIARQTETATYDTETIRSTRYIKKKKKQPILKYTQTLPYLFMGAVTLFCFEITVVSIDHKNNNL